MSTFEQLAKRWGGALSIDDLPKDQKPLFHQIDTLLRGLIRDMDRMTPGPVVKPLVAGVLRDRSFNAIAASSDEVDFVGFNAGTALYLYYLANTLLSHPGTFLRVGDPKKEVLNRHRDIQRALRDPDWLALNWLSTSPIDMDRRIYAGFLAAQATIFIFLHEFGHVFNGHCDFKRGENAISEIAAPVERDMSGLDSQTLELDADCFAAFTMAACPLDTNWANMVLPLVRSTTPFQDCTSLWIAGAGMFFRSIAADTPPDQPFKSSHPPARCRQTSISGTALERVKRDLPSYMEEFEAGSIEGFLELERAYMILTGQALRPPKMVENGGYMMPDYWSAGVDHVEPLLANWKVLRPQLEPLVRRGILAD